MKYLSCIAVVIALSLLLGCTTGVKLSNIEKDKLDPALQNLILGNPVPEKNYTIKNLFLHPPLLTRKSKSLPFHRYNIYLDKSNSLAEF